MKVPQWTGLGAVIAKEMADHLTSARMRILEILIILTAGGTVYAAILRYQKDHRPGPLPLSEAVHHLCRTVAGLYRFSGFFWSPLIAISLSFDSVNGEFNRRTMSRVLSQPIYRDALLLGKFLAGLFTLALVFSAIWLLIFGLGMLGLGLPPSGEEVARSLIFLVATIFYGGILAGTGAGLFDDLPPAGHRCPGIHRSLDLFPGILEHHCFSAVPDSKPNPTRLYPGTARSGSARTGIIQGFLPTPCMPRSWWGCCSQPYVRWEIVLPSQLQGAVMGTPAAVRAKHPVDYGLNLPA